MVEAMVVFAERFSDQGPSVNVDVSDTFVSTSTSIPNLHSILKPLVLIPVVLSSHFLSFSIHFSKGWM